MLFFFFSSRRRHTRLQGDWSSDVCSSDLSFSRRAWSACARRASASRPPRPGFARCSRPTPAGPRLKTSTVSRGLGLYLSAARARVDAVVARWGESLDGLWPPPVPAAVRYSLLSEGKRLRPTLVFACHEAVGGGGAAAAVAELAAAVEVVHAYSLVHDDLPCMDNDDLRRGRPTTHRAFDVPTATRAGFHMVALAARGLAVGLATLAPDSERRRAIALELFRAAGAGGMIGGQALGLGGGGGRAPGGGVAEIHRRKTGALIAASCVIGGLAGGALPPAGAPLRGYGALLGLAFPIR